MDDEEIKPNDRIKTTSRGLIHKLTIDNSKPHDEGKYTVAFDEVKSTASLTVKGKSGLLFAAFICKFPINIQDVYPN